MGEGIYCGERASLAFLLQELTGESHTSFYNSNLSHTFSKNARVIYNEKNLQLNLDAQERGVEFFGEKNECAKLFQKLTLKLFPLPPPPLIQIDLLNGIILHWFKQSFSVSGTLKCIFHLLTFPFNIFYKICFYNFLENHTLVWNYFLFFNVRLNMKSK